VCWWAGIFAGMVLSWLYALARVASAVSIAVSAAGIAVLISATGRSQRSSWVRAHCASVSVVWARLTASRACLRAGLSIGVASGAVSAW
jgi:hypothetical protein